MQARFRRRLPPYYHTNARRTWRLEQIWIEAHALENRTRLQALASIGLQQSPDLLGRHVITLELRKVCFSLKAIADEHGCESPEPGPQALEEGLAIPVGSGTDCTRTADARAATQKILRDMAQNMKVWFA